MSQSSVQNNVRTASWSLTKDSPTVRCEHTWKINNFDQKLRMRNGNCLKSGRLDINSYKRIGDFQLKLYPNGKTIENKGYVSIFFEVSGSPIPSPEEIEIQCSVVTNVKKPITKTVTYPFQFGISVTEKGFPNFLKHSEFSLLAGHSFTLYCQISFLGATDVVSGCSPIHEPILLKSLPAVVPASKLSFDMTSLFESGEHTDCIVVCDGREIKCLKGILGARSSVFRAMFEHEMTENRSGRVEINDFDQDVVYEMLLYIYSGQVNDLEGKAASLIAAADKYDLMELKQMCEVSLCENLSVVNVCESLIVSKLHTCSVLQSNALKYMKDNCNQIMAQAGWMEKLKHHPDLLSSMFETLATLGD